MKNYLDKAIDMLVTLLPARLIYRCGIAIWGHGTIGRYEGTPVEGLTLEEALRRWREDKCL
jgi:hypothetical protein